MPFTPTESEKCQRRNDQQKRKIAFAFACCEWALMSIEGGKATSSQACVKNLVHRVWGQVYQTTLQVYQTCNDSQNHVRKKWWHNHDIKTLAASFSWSFRYGSRNPFTSARSFSIHTCTEAGPIHTLSPPTCGVQHYTTQGHVRSAPENDTRRKNVRENHLMWVQWTSWASCVHF